MQVFDPKHGPWTFVEAVKVEKGPCPCPMTGISPRDVSNWGPGPGQVP